MTEREVQASARDLLAAIEAEDTARASRRAVAERKRRRIATLMTGVPTRRGLRFESGSPSLGALLLLPLLLLGLYSAERQDLLGWLLVGLAAGLGILNVWRMLTIGLYLTDTGVKVRNVAETRSVGWDQLVGYTVGLGMGMPPRSPRVLVLQLRDGTSITVQSVRAEGSDPEVLETLRSVISVIEQRRHAQTGQAELTITGTLPDDPPLNAGMV